MHVLQNSGDSDSQLNQPDKRVLSPSEFYFGNSGEQIQTLLGSCVAITMWNPRQRIGGMCHFLLPDSPNTKNMTLDGRYADQAIDLFLAELRRSGTKPEDYEVKVFGGGNMFPAFQRGDSNNIGKRNVQAARRLLKENDFNVHSEHTGNVGHRSVILDLSTGYTWVKWQKL